MSSNQVLLVIVGVWIFMRTITKDSNGQTLVDHLTGLGKSSTASTSTPSTSTSSGSYTATSAAATAAAATTLPKTNGVNVTAAGPGAFKVAGS